MAEMHTPACLAIHDSEYPIAGPGCHQKSIPLPFLESSFDETFLERLIGIGEAFLSSIKRPPKIKVQIFHYVPRLVPLSARLYFLQGF